MKKLLPVLIVLGVFSVLILKNVKGEHSKTNSESKSPLSLLNGCWKRIGIITNGKPESNPLPQIRLFHEGFYTIISQDSTKVWRQAFGGTYEINGDVYKEKTLYCTYSTLIGNTHWQELKIRGDTISFKFFKRMIDSTGNEIPAPNYTREIICLRMKK